MHGWDEPAGPALHQNPFHRQKGGPAVASD